MATTLEREPAAMPSVTAPGPAGGPRGIRRLAVPGPRPLPLLGPTGNVIRFAADSIGESRRLFDRFGPVTALVAGGGTRLYSPLPDCPGTVLTYGPEPARQVASHHDVFWKHPLTFTLYPTGEVPPRRAPLKHFMVGLFGVNGEEHRQERRLLMPAFHKKRIEAYRDDMVAIAQSELDRWRPGETRDMAEAMRLLTLRVATKTLFGLDVGERGGGIGRLLQDAIGTTATPLATRLPLDLPGLPYRRFLDLIHRYDDEMRAIIASKRAAGADEGDVLSMLLAARDEQGAPLSEDELLGHTGVFFAAGHETSANALTWTLFLLAQHPAVAADLLDELAGELRGTAPTVEQLAKLPLLERVVKESMRVLGPVPWNARVMAAADEVGGYELPAGTEVFVSIYETHHMPELYPRPEAFDPRRWETISPGPYEYMPFSAGPRMCIGAGFAMLEIRLVLAMLLQRYRLQCLPNFTVDRSGLVVVTPGRGMPMHIHTQDGRFAEGVGGIRGNVREMVELPD